MARRLLRSGPLRISTIAAGSVAPLRAKSLSFLDRYLTLRILLAMAAGVLLGRFIPGVEVALGRMSVGTTNVLLAAGLVFMTYPPFAKVRYKRLPEVFRDKRLGGLEMDAAGAGFRADYEDLSHFSQGHKKHSGDPPVRDVKGLRTMALSD